MLVVDDHDVVQWGFRLMLGQLPWVSRCVGAQDLEQAVEMTDRYAPNVAVVDLFVGDESGVEISTRLRELRPGLKVLLVSGAGNISANAARAAGASGFVSKDLPAADIASAVRMVGLGHSVFPPQDQAPEVQLTAREREVLGLMGAGSTNREIADALHLSHHTIKEHTSALYRKLDVRNRAEAVRTGQRLGLVD